MFRGVGFQDFPPSRDGTVLLPPVESKPADLAEVHLFTGVNGTGKTRLLAALAAMLGHPQPLLRRGKLMDEPLDNFAYRDYLGDHAPSA